MSKFKKGLMKRVMAVILSGAMVMSNMTVFASEAPADTGGGYVEEVADDVSKDDETESKSADNQSEDEKAVSEETSKSEDNASTEKDDTDDAKETSVETTETETTKTEASDDERTSETESSLSAETEEAESTEETETETETTEEDTEDEDVKADTLQEMTFSNNEVYTFNAADVASDSISSQKEILIGEGYFSLLCGGNTEIYAQKPTRSFYYYDETSANAVSDATITKAINMGADVNKDCAIKFKVSKSVDVTVYWVAGEKGNQMSILDENGKAVIKTYEVESNLGIYISTMTLKEAGTYYLGGNNKIYKVKIEPEIQKRTYWDFTATDSSAEGYVSPAVSKGMQYGDALEYFDLRVSTDESEGNGGNGGKFQKRASDVQVNIGTIVHVPIAGRSKVTFTLNGATYTVDGEAATATEQSFICRGEGGYATLKITSSTYLKKIKVEPISTVTVAGSVTLNSEKTEAYQVIFTEKTDSDNKTVIAADVNGDSYTADLYTGVTYTVSLSDKAYNVTDGAEITVAEDASGSQTHNIGAEKLNATEITGSIEFVNETDTELPNDFKLKFESQGEGAAHIPEVTIDKENKTYTVSLENSSTYTVTAEGTGIKDYELLTTELSVDSASKDIQFEKKPTYEVTLKIESFDDKADISAKEIEFTNTEDDYTYTFKGADAISLRDGVYSIGMNVEYPYQLNLSGVLEINGEAAEYTLNFDERMEWDFTAGDPMLEDTVKQNTTEDQPYNGLVINTAGSKTITNASNEELTSYGKFGVSIKDKRVQVNATTEIRIPVSGKGTVQIVNQTKETNHYTMDGEFASEEPQTWIYDKPAASYGADGEYIPGGYVTLQAVKTSGTSNTLKGESIYLQKIIITRDKEVETSSDGKIDVWDFAGKEEADTDKYINNITPTVWKTANIIGTGEKKGYFTGESKDVKTYDFGDLTMTYHGQDRMYSNLDEMQDISVDKKFAQSYTDGYTSAGAWYCNGGGTETTRNVTINNVKAGDKIIAYMGKHNDGQVTFYFAGQGSASAQKESVILESTSAEYQKCEFTAEYDGTYKIYSECTNNGKILYHRIMRIPVVEVSGTINFGSYTGTDYTVKFVDQENNLEAVAEVNEDKTYTVNLTPGYTYTAVLSGAAGYGFADTNKTVTVNDGDSVTGIKNIDLTVEAKDTYTYSGNITGFASDYQYLDRLAVTMVPSEGSTADKVKLTINEDKSFSALLESDIEYTIQIEGVNDYSLTSESTIKKTADYEADITVEAKSTYEVSGGFLDLNGAELTELTFTRFDEEGKQDKNYVYTAAIVGNGYSVKLRDGIYVASAKVNGYRTQTRVTVDGKAVTRDLLFVCTDTSALEWQSDLYVDKNDPDKYQTVSAAVKAAKRMNPSSEAKRITIHIAPGTYREQITVDVPYITFKNDTPSEEVKLTWYYGVGYKYYSINPTSKDSNGNYKYGFYDAERAYDKYEKNEVFRWGCTVLVKGTDFKAENIIFENSFNRYLTEEEIEDGVEPTETSGKPVRDNKLDVRSRAAGERSAVLYIEDQGDRAEFYRCQFLSNQDTMGTGSTTPRSYFKECLIEGNTDYICGAGDAVFEDCELKFAGYSDASSGGYITAASQPREYGYLFWNCKVTGTTKSGTNKDKGYLGRPWFNPTTASKKATVTFVNTVLESADIIQPVGWNSMSGTTPEQAAFKEFNTTLADGTPADTSKRTAGTVVSENPVTDMTVYFGDWTPSYYNHVDAPEADEERSEVPMGTKVTLTCSTEGADIYYTIDGSEPSADSGIAYDAATGIVLDTEGNIIIKAIAVKGDAVSKAATFEYSVVDSDKFVEAPEVDIKPGRVVIGTKLTLSCKTEDAVIYYTTGEADPDSSSTAYDNEKGIVLDEAGSVTIKAIAIKGDAKSAVKTFAYTVEKVEKPTANVTDNEVLKGQKITLSCATADAVIYYTINGGEPTEESSLYNKLTGIVLDKAGEITIRAIAVKDGAKSDIAVFNYTVKDNAPVTEVVKAPEADVTPGKVTKGTTVSLTCATEGATIYYTMDETEPTEKSTVYTEAISLGNEVKKVVIKAIAVKAGKTSTVSTFEYMVSEDGTVEKQQVQAPKATPAAGAVAAGTTVMLTSDTADAKIYYTTDGKTPTTASTLYTAPITITAAVTIQAIAVKEGWKDSEVVTFAYTISSNPDVPPVVVKRIKLEECEITVPSVMRNAKAGNNQPSVTYVTYKYTDESGEEKHVKFAEDLDYSVSWNGVVSAEDKTVYSVTLTGLGRTADQFEIDPESTMTVTYKVYDKPGKDSKVKIVDISKAKINLDASAKKAVYTGYAIEPKLDLSKDKDGLKDKINIAYRNNINAGKATVIISAKPDAGDEKTVYVGSKTLTFTIQKAALNKTAAKATAKVVWDESFSFTAGHDYTGTPVTVTGLKVESSKGRTLKLDEDYTVTYKNNAKAGKATVTVKGIGNNLSGSWTQNFTIKPVDLKKLTFNKDVKLPYSPKGAKLAEIDVLGENGEVLYTLTEGIDYTAKYTYSDKKTKAAGSKVTVTISGKGACTGKDIKLGDFEIIKGDFATCITVPEDIAVDGKNLAKELEKAIKVTDVSGAKLSVKTNYTIGTPDKEAKTVELKPVDTKNYENTCIVKFRVATNLAKDKGFAFKKNAKPLEYDGRNPVELTADIIETNIGAKYKLGENIEIVPGTYKNNMKKGTASVTVRGKAGVDGGFYGTKVLKFKIVEK